MSHPNRVLDPLAEHLELTLIVLAISVVLAAALTLVALRWGRARSALLAAFSIVYSIPSLALFSLLIPVTGLGTVTATIVLVAYNQYLLLRNFLTGIDEVDPAVVEAAQGIGMTPWQTLVRVQVPLATPALFAGVRLAVVSTVGIATIAAFINAGGLGTLLSDGIRTMNMNKILWGSLLSAGLALVLNGVLGLAEKRLARGGGVHAAADE